MKFRRKEAKRVKAQVDLTPLIDVVFQLLIFFMLSATFVVQSSLPIDMPEAEGTVQLESKDLTITLRYGEGGPDGQGQVFVNKEEITDWKRFSSLLAEEVAKRPDLIVLWRSDGRIPVSRMIKVWGIATDVGIERFRVAAQPPPEEG